MPYRIGMDIASGDDYTCITYWKRASKLRRFLRRLRLDHSIWEWKLIKSEFKR